MPNERCLPYEPHSRHVSNVLYPMVLSMSAKLHRLTRDMPSRLSIRKETNLSIKNKEVQRAWKSRSTESPASGAPLSKDELLGLW